MDIIKLVAFVYVAIPALKLQNKRVFKEILVVSICYIVMQNSAVEEINHLEGISEVTSKWKKEPFAG